MVPASDIRLDEDERLALDAAADPAAFETIYLRYRETVFRYLRARARDREDALDLTGLTFERAFESIGRYRPIRGGFGAWLLRIARNAAIDHERKLRRKPLLTRVSDIPDLTAENDPETQIVRADDHRRLRVLVRALPEPQRDAIALRYVVGLSSRQIGLVIGKSEEATQKLISRALTELKEAYQR